MNDWLDSEVYDFNLGWSLLQPVSVLTFSGVVCPSSPKKTDYQSSSVLYPEDGRTVRLGTLVRTLFYIEHFDT